MAPVIGYSPSATSVNRARVFICERVSTANWDPVSSPLTSRFSETRFSHINTNQLYTLTKEDPGSPQTEGLVKVGESPAITDHINSGENISRADERIQRPRSRRERRGPLPVMRAENFQGRDSNFAKLQLCYFRGPHTLKHWVL